MAQDIPSARELLALLEKAGGTLPQSDFDIDWNEAGDFCFFHGLTDNTAESITLTAKGRHILHAASPV